MVKTSPANAGGIRDAGSTPGSGRSPGEGHGNPLQYSCLENPMDRGAWRATVHGGHTESETTEVTQHACTHAVRRVRIQKVLEIATKEGRHLPTDFSVIEQVLSQFTEHSLVCCETAGHMIQVYLR